MATYPIKDLIPATASLPMRQWKDTEPSTSAWLPATFDAAWPETEAQRASLAVAVDLCRRFVAHAENHAQAVRAARSGEAEIAPIHPYGAGWLTLSGVFGCGKTKGLAEPIYAYLRRIDPYAEGPWFSGSNTYRAESRRPECVFQHVNAFIDCTLGGDYSYPEWLGRDWLVVIDDLGANRQGSENSREAANDAISRLCAARQGKLTIFTTNWTVGELAQRVDGRVASRVIRDADGNFFHRITAGDYALRRKGGRP